MPLVGCVIRLKLDDYHANVLLAFGRGRRKIGYHGQLFEAAVDLLALVRTCTPQIFPSKHEMASYIVRTGVAVHKVCHQTGPKEFRSYQLPVNKRKQHYYGPLSRYVSLPGYGHQPLILQSNRQSKLRMAEILPKLASSVYFRGTLRHRDGSPRCSSDHIPQAV